MPPAVSEGLRRRGPCAPTSRYSPRPETFEHPGGYFWPAKNPGLRDRQIAGCARRRNRDRRTDADAELCKSRTAPWGQSDHGYGCLLARRGLIQTGDGPFTPRVRDSVVARHGNDRRDLAHPAAKPREPQSAERHRLHTSEGASL